MGVRPDTKGEKSREIMWWNIFRKNLFLFVHLDFDNIFFGKYSYHKIMKIEESSRENTGT